VSRQKKTSPAARRSSSERLARGRARDGARFTAPAPAGDMPSGYVGMLNEIKSRVQQARLRTLLAANASMVLAYWEVGPVILARQQSEGWGAKVIDRLSDDLRAAFPDMQGLSPRNLKYTRAFAAAWPEGAIVQGPPAQIGWYQNIALLDKLASTSERLCYAQKAGRRICAAWPGQAHRSRSLEDRARRVTAGRAARQSADRGADRGRT